MTELKRNESGLLVCEVLGGATIDDACVDLVRLANAASEPVAMDFNGIQVIANPGSNAQALVEFHSSESKRRYDAYLASPEYKQSQKDAADRDEQRKLTLRQSLTTAPDKLTLRDPEGWQKSVDANTDGYGGAVITYADLWARLMEVRMAGGATVADVAKECSSIADVEGITGFMYGCAVSILSKVWIHGEDLRRWHNLDTQLGTEGEKANESGGVLNPALLSVDVGN